MALNYDLSVDKNIIYQDEARPEEIRNKLLSEDRLSWFEKQTMKLKYWSSPMNIIHCLSWDNFMDYDPHKDEITHLKNPLMNNLDQIDYCNKDWTDDHDSLIPKHSQEFPRLSASFNSRFDESKPWG
jgi:hypothetical protein